MSYVPPASSRPHNILPRSLPHPQHNHPPLSSPAVRIQSFSPNQFRPSHSDYPAMGGHRQGRGSEYGGSPTSSYYRSRSPPGHHHHHPSINQALSPPYPYPNSPPPQHNHPIDMRGHKAGQQLSPGDRPPIYEGQDGRPRARSASHHHHHHSPLSPILANPMVHPSAHVQYPMSLPNGHSSSMYTSPPSQIFPGMPHDHHLHGGVAPMGAPGMATMINPMAPAMAEATLGAPPASMVDPLGAHEFTTFTAMTGANLHTLPFASPHYPGVGGVGYPNAMPMCRSIEALPGPGSYGHPRHPSFAKPDYRRFCFSVGKADVPYAAVGQPTPHLGM